MALFGESLSIAEIGPVNDFSGLAGHRQCSDR
jgi:hypothetical protein